MTKCLCFLTKKIFLAKIIFMSIYKYRRNMKINLVTANNIYKTNFNKVQTSVCFGKQLVSDCFVKSSSVSFGANDEKTKRSQNVEFFMNDLGKKLNSAKFSVNDISNSMRKYDKNVCVKDMKKAPRELLFSKSLQGLYCSDLMYDEENNSFFIPKENRIFYVRTETLKNQFGKAEAYVNAVHEFSHVLQSDDDEVNQIGLFNKYLADKNDDIDSAINQVSIASALAPAIEEGLAKPFMDALYSNEDMAYERLQNGRLDFVEWLSRKNKITDFDSYVQNSVNAKIALAQDENKVELDKNLFLDLSITHFSREIEAYKNENKAFKKCLNIDSVRAMTRVQLYEKFIDVLKTMKD